MKLNEGELQDSIHFFCQVTGHAELRGWQRDLIAEQQPRSRLIRIPTGLGKTEGVLATWMWHATSKPNARARMAWPRRLVWCLPMRVLVEQTGEVASRLVKASELDIGVHTLMGGIEPSDWHLYPERPAILIGTQDMLLSRTLNRGYAAGRARWPHDFGLLNHDCLWVMDEIQLMDVGLATSAQLQAYRDRFQKSGFRPCHTWWMSATLQPEWLLNVDTTIAFDDWSRAPCQVSPESRQGGVWQIEKALTTQVVPTPDAKGFGELVLERHSQLKSGEHGKITLVVCNTVERAIATHAALQKKGRKDGLELVHSRFRPYERKRWNEFLKRRACNPEADRIIVATQVVEAGVDISAGCLVTELAPWPSLVQRFGRCARYGGSGQVVVVDRGQDEKSALPYESDALTSAWNAVQQLNDVGIRRLEEFEAALDTESRKELYPYSPAHLLMEEEFVELFDTTADLTGADLDISRFIRSGDERDLQVFWTEVSKKADPDSKRQPLRDELCSVPFLAARDWLCGKETKSNRKPRLRNNMRAWIWDWIEGQWVGVTREMLLPGRIVCVATECGGYLSEVGFAPDSPVKVDEVPIPEPESKVDPDDENDSKQDGEPLSQTSDWKTIAYHSHEVAQEVRGIGQVLELPSHLLELMELAASWHDLGKAHPAFQGMLRSSETEKRPARFDLAKGPKSAWIANRSKLYTYLDDSDQRPGFRHELASALALFAVLRQFAPQHEALLGSWTELFEAMSRAIPEPVPECQHAEIQRILACTADDFNLLVYLIASHHGKVRVALHAAPADQDYQIRQSNDRRGLPIRGVRNGDIIPAISITPSGAPLPEITLSLEPASLGLSFATGASWRERTQQLTRHYGPAALGYLEAILRSADVRASQSTAADPAFTEGEVPQ
ncbi:MAG: CRISPR-associated endonuclease Cas3'' [Planctomycetaceae bacterium]|nr:CRISPR-associated endonuclease Cas3'' [Planctomycetaceae bacterium]